MSKEIVVRFRADADDRRRLEELAKHYAVTPSTLLRMLLMRTSRELGLEPAAKPVEPAPVVPSPVKKPAKAAAAKPKGKGRRP